MYKLSLLVLSLATLCFAYDFKDSIFNEYLVEELKDTDLANAPAFRFKRDAPDDKCSPHKRMSCCKSDKVDPTGLEHMKKIKMECYKEIKGDDDFSIDPFDCEASQKLKQSLICISECIGKKLDAINDKGELDRDKVIEYFKKKFADEPWKLEKSEEIIDKCLPESKEKSSSEKGECNAQSMNMAHCIWREYFQNCPKDLQIDSMRCNKIREKIAKNDEGYLKLAQFHRLVHMFQKEE